jgi:hypothetical protein
MGEGWEVALVPGGVVFVVVGFDALATVVGGVLVCDDAAAQLSPVTRTPSSTAAAVPPAMWMTRMS